MDISEWLHIATVKFPDKNNDRYFVVVYDLVARLVCIVAKVLMHRGFDGL